MLEQGTVLSNSSGLLTGDLLSCDPIVVGVWQVLKARRPDVDTRRAGLLKLQGEFQARLRELEEQLLRELSSVSGNILDNDTIINSLERLKTEAADVTKQVNVVVLLTLRMISCKVTFCIGFVDCLTGGKHGSGDGRGRTSVEAFHTVCRDMLASVLLATAAARTALLVPDIVDVLLGDRRPRPVLHTHRFRYPSCS